MKKKEREIAFQLYMGGKSCEAIAMIVQVRKATVLAWVKKYHWERLHSAKTITRSSLLQESYAQLDKLNREVKEKYEGVPTLEHSKIKNVLVEEIKNLSASPLEVYIDIISEFMDFVKGKKGGGEMITYCDAFITKKAGE